MVVDLLRLNHKKVKKKINGSGSIWLNDWSQMVEGFTKDGIGYIPSTMGGRTSVRQDPCPKLGSVLPAGLGQDPIDLPNNEGF